MKVFVAGASGAIGIPIVGELLKHGHEVSAMTRSGAGAQALSKFGVSVLDVDALDPQAVQEAVDHSSPEVVIDMLTSLPKNPAELMASFPADKRLRLEGGGNLYSAALNCGVKRYIEQSSGFWIKPRHGTLGTEADGFQVDATPNIAMGSQMYTDLESRVLKPSAMQGVALRYGFFYGPGTWYDPAGGAADLVRTEQMRIIGAGSAVNSFIHIDDAAVATVAALTCEPGVYNVVDSDPVAVSTWLPAFARSVGAPPPPRISEETGLEAGGSDAVFYHNGLSGASNEKAKAAFGFNPRALTWLGRS